MTDDPQPEAHLYLVDGTSQLFRAYFAIRGLTGPSGAPTNAVFGFTAMLRKLLKEEKPAYLGVAFDPPGDVFRNERFAEYKAHRPPVPDDLLIQMPIAKDVCRVHRIPVLEIAGFEADDVIATCARHAREAGFRVTVVASDKDLLQLVGDGVQVLNPSKNVLLDAAGVTETFGVPPERVIDVLGLMGDAVDNIPGVPGVGEKTALAMVRTYGPLERVLARAARFVELFAARDGMSAALEVGAGEFQSARHALEQALSALRAVESDAEFRARLEELGRILTRAEGGNAGSLRELKKGLSGIERGSSRKAWSAVLQHRADAELSRELATLHYDVPVAFELDALRVRSADPKAASELFLALGFRTLAAEAAGALPADSVPDEEVAEPIEEVETREMLARLRSEALRAKRIAVTLRAGEGHPVSAPLEGIAIACEAGPTFQVSIRRDPFDGSASLTADDIRSALGSIFSEPGIEVIGHDVKRSMHVLRAYGMPAPRWALDTRVAGFLLDPGRSTYPVDRLAQELLGTSRTSRVDCDDDPRAARTILPLASALRSQLDADGLSDLYRNVEGPLLPVLARMEAAGIRVDPEVLAPMSSAMAESLAHLRRRIQELAGTPLNPDSPKQLREVLFGSLGLASKRRTRKSGVESTDAEALEQLADEHEIARELLRYRELAKLKGTYVDALPALIQPATGRIHTTFDPAGAATGRLSSSDPNLQNIPVRTESGRKIRSAFVPQAGWLFLSADYSQVELRILAHLCQDPELIAAFRAGEDVHRRTAGAIFGISPDLVTDDMRRRAKAVNFGVLYGMSEVRLAREQGIPRADARKFIAAYFERFRTVAEYIERIRSQAMREGEVRTLFGRRRGFPALRGRAGRAEVEQALRAAVNTTIQGTAADLMKMAMIRVDGALAASGLKARMLLQVHDELLLEVEPADLAATTAVVRAEMEGVFPLDVPLVVDSKSGRNWSEVA